MAQFTSDQWKSRDLGAVNVIEIDGAALSASQVTLCADEYTIFKEKTGQ